ncbi:MAG TPA: hypothetical protein P5119_07855 [Candidatus Aminicenantes bacterium]|nr:hypothetical protein [Candidatus Aminicenantes bacterium]HRY65241.1 hypothetical protein [Candidatus Aminicenantes bacterium]HRZ72291.1 hypothetical protein [Candidatus Aminicenantes bacterium]
MTWKHKGLAAGAVLAGFLTLSSCAALTDMASALASLKKLQFKLGGVHDFKLLGLDLGGKARIGDFSAADGLRALQAYRNRTLPVEFVVDVLAVNPNDGTGGSRNSTSTLTGLECRLLIDDKPTVTGNIDRPIEIPGTGKESVIPLRLSLDLLEFFGDRRYEDLIGLALAIGGRNGTPARIALDAQPTVSTPLGPITYPSRITIVSAEFR